jgi:hypothetical protein
MPSFEDVLDVKLGSLQVAEIFLGNVSVWGAGTFAEGGSVQEIGGYRIHTFAADGQIDFRREGDVEYLIVAAGGTGGPADNSPRGGGGGGSGGLLTGSRFVGRGVYPVVVGPTNPAANLSTQSNGGNSSVFGLAAIGGGFGARGNVGSPPPGGSGGSGGGGSRGSAGGSGTTGQGNNGGSVPGEDVSGGGGGGRESAASGATPGSGFVSSISGSSTVYAVGGAGGAANGARPGNDAPSGLGYGGEGGNGDSGSEQLGGDGGSGIVIIRYPV